MKLLHDFIDFFQFLHGLLLISACDIDAGDLVGDFLGDLVLNLLGDLQFTLVGVTTMIDILLECK